MSIPIISDVLDGIKYIISFFVERAPRPVQFIFFMLMIIVAALLVPFMLHIFGIHCNSGGQVVSTSILAVGTNIQLAFMDAQEQYNNTNINPSTISPVLETCYRSICLGDDGIYHWSMEDACDNKTIVFPYKSRTWQYWQCTVCAGDINTTFIQGKLFASETLDLCFGNAFLINDSDKNWYQNTFCNEGAQCVPPVNYFYNYSRGTYDCAVPAICGVNVTLSYYPVDEELLNAHGELMYQNVAKEDYRSFVMFQCDGERKPQITIYGIPIFDYRIWVIITLIVILIYGLSKVGWNIRM